jgi:hypothetical protein
MQRHLFVAITSIAASTFLAGCGKKEEPPAPAPVAEAPKPAEPASADPKLFLTQPLAIDIYSADPSAHVFNGKLYVYPSHDYDSGIPADDLGNQYAMKDYQVLSFDQGIGGPVTVNPVALDIKDVPWASEKMWAPDAAEKDGKYYLYFPVKDKEGVFRIGAAVGDSPGGPVQGAARSHQEQLQHGPRGVQGHGRQVLHVLSAASGAASCRSGRPASSTPPTMRSRRMTSRRCCRRSRGWPTTWSSSPRSRRTSSSTMNTAS